MPADVAFSPKKLFREVKWEVYKVHFLNQFVSAAIVFFACNIILTVWNMSFIWSALIALAVFAYRITRGWKRNTLRKLEEGNPEVHEILRTAYEHQETNSLMVQGLMFDLQRKLSTVSAGVLLDPRRLLSKLMIVFALAFIPLLIISFTPWIIQESPVSDLDLGAIWNGGPQEAIRQLTGVELNRSNDIYGDANVADLGNRQLDVEVVSGGGMRDFSNTGAAEDNDFRFNDYPADVDVVQSGDYDDSGYAAADLDLINDYSCRARGQC